VNNSTQPPQPSPDKPPVADFNSNVTSGNAPLAVQFNDLSKNATQWDWNFGDGNISSARNPVNVYSVAGSYTVSLNASNANGSTVSIKQNFITVSSQKKGHIWRRH
jgi:PKD repeat protein